MASPAQISANRLNAAHSTGPQTDEGKARSSRNALKHGLNSKEFFVREDEQEEFAELRDSLLEELQPYTAVLRHLYGQVLHAAWRMHRADRLEAELLATGSLADDSTRQQIELLARYRTRAERAYYRAMHAFRDYRTNLAEIGSLPTRLAAKATGAVEVKRLHQAMRDSRAAWRGDFHDSSPDASPLLL